MLPRELFEEPEADKRVISESQREGDTIVGWEVTDIKWGNGIQTYVAGANFPQKGLASPEAIWAINIVKRMIIKGLELVNPLRSFTKIIENFTDIGWQALGQVILKRQYLTSCSREIIDLTVNFLSAYGLEGLTASRFALILGHIVEYDNAYRLRIEDLCFSTTKEKLLADPRKEITRLLELNADREMQHPQVAAKFKKIGWVISSLLLLPKVNRAFRTAIEKCTFANLQLDNSDKYWACHRQDYDFMGMDYETRGKMLEQAGYKRVEGKRVKI